jgi:hypothetical protein
MSGALSPLQMQAANANLRSHLLNVSSDMQQSIYSGTIVPASSPVLSIAPRLVGLAKGFLVEISGTFTNSGAGVATRTGMGPANILSNVSLFDLDNYQRINTNGIHLHMLNTQKEGWPFGSALTTAALDAPFTFGNNTRAITCPATIAGGGGTGAFRMFYYVPLAYSNRDLRGSIFLGVINASANLQLTFNSAISGTSGDTLNAVYSGGTANVAITTATVTVYQSYLDQLPRWTSGPNAGGPMLPPLDVASQYRLISSTLTGVAAGQEFPVPFSNFQEFLSLLLVYNQAEIGRASCRERVSPEV